MNHKLLAALLLVSGFVNAEITYFNDDFAVGKVVTNNKDEWMTLMNRGIIRALLGKNIIGARDFSYRQGDKFIVEKGNEFTLVYGIVLGTNGNKLTIALNDDETEKMSIDLSSIERLYLHRSWVEEIYKSTAKIHTTK